MQDFCTKMNFPPWYMIFRGIGASQHYLVGFLSLLSPQARGASLISDVFTVPKCLQRNMWWNFRAQIEIIPSYLHRPGARGERYPNWFNSIFEFRQKMIQFNIQFNTISQKFNSENYSIQKNLRKFNSKNYSIQKISEKSNSKNYSIQ